MIFTCSTATGRTFFRHQARQTFVQGQPKSANTFRAQPQRRGQHQVGSIRLQQIRRTDIGLKSPGDQGDHIHEGLGRLAALLRETADLLQGQDVTLEISQRGDE